MSKNEVVAKEETLPAVINFEEDRGGGFEEADGSCFAIPFLKILQSLSPERKSSKPEYIPGAEDGDFVNSVTGTVWKRSEGVIVVPCHFSRKFNEWAPNRGGFRGSHDAYEGERMMQECTMVEKVGMVLPNGNTLQDTREHYLIAITPSGGWDMVMLSLTSTQTKHSKKWMTLMQNIRINNNVAPMFSQMYKLTSVIETKDQNEWMSVKATHLKQIDNAELYQYAKHFREMIRSGKAQVVAQEDSGEYGF